ncbi:MAG: DUF3347 domain-containing protein [Bacteroidetes bacterium]|nr:DUF3347 domain-containing protein [Bacteroidota bacterium]
MFLALVSCSGGKKQDTQSDEKMSDKKETVAVVNNNGSSASMHKQHNSLADNFTHKDIVILDKVYEVNENTKAELDEVIDAYIQLKNAFVKDDEQATDKAAGLMAQKAAAIVPAKLEGKGLEAWKNHQALYVRKLKEMLHTKGFENKRSYFSHLSEIMYCTIKSFGLKQGNLFAVFCPMAFDNKGAYWISDSKVIQNPYLGAKMPACGEIKEEL